MIEMTDCHSKINIVIIPYSRESLIEAPESHKYFRANEQRRARTSVDVAPEIVSRIVRIVETTVFPIRAITPDDRASFLQSIIRIDDLRTDGANRRIGFGNLDESV